MIVRQRIPRQTLETLAREGFGDMVKAVVDVSRRLLAMGGDLHSDLESALLEDGSRQADLWGINIYPDGAGDDWIEFDSLINVRPSQGNRSRAVDDPASRHIIVDIVTNLVAR